MYSKSLALVGGGYWGKNLARNFHSLKALHTICDANPQTLANFTEGYAGVEKSSSFDSLLSSNEITQVAIAAPAELHYQLAKAALEARKDVFVEKPLCLTVSQGEELVAIAKRQNAVLMVGHLLQYHPCIEAIRGMLANGEIGRLQYITSNRLNLGKIRSEENALWSFAPHDLSVILSLLGGQPPESLQCTGDAWLTPGVADTTLTSMKFSGAVSAHVFVSWLNPFKEQKLTVVGTRAMVVFDDTLPWEEKLTIYRHRITWENGRDPTAAKANGEAVKVEQSEPLKNECAHFLDCCAKRVAPRTDGIEGLNVLKVLAMAQLSMEQQGQRVGIQDVSTARTPSELAIHATAVVDAGAQVGQGTRVWHFSHVSANASIGERCNLGQNVFVAPNVHIGNNVKIQNNVSIYSGTTIDNDVFLGPSCVLTNVSNPRSQINRQGLYEQTHLKVGSTVGANSTIVCGVTVGRYAFIAAGAVVTKDIPDYGYVRGVPAKQVGWMSRHGHSLDFGDDLQAHCPESGFTYALHKSQDGIATVSCLDIHEDAPLPSVNATGQESYRTFKQIRNS